MSKPKKMTRKEFRKAIFDTVGLSFRTSPGAVLYKLAGIGVDALLPIAITYFAARTTTQLAEAFAGNKEAGRLAIYFIIITAILGFIGIAWRSVDQYIQSMVRFKIEAKVSDMMYEHFLSLDFWRYDDKETVDLYDRAQKFSQFYAYVFDRLSGILSQFITLVFSLVALAFFLPWIAVMVLLAVLPGLFIQFKLSRLQVAHWNGNVENRRSQSLIEWNLLQPNSIAELRLNGLVRYLLNLRQKLRDTDQKGHLLHERKYIWRRLLADLLEAGTELAALIWVATQIINHNQPLGQFVYVQQMVSRALGSANGFISQLSTIDEDLANLFDYQKFMNLPPTIRQGKMRASAPNTIAFNDVSFHYPKSDNNVLQHVSFEFNAGQHIAIVGENGAGKSTLIKLLTGLYNPTEGALLINNQPLADIEIESWHKQLSVLQQEFERYTFTNIKNNVYFGNVSEPLSKEKLQFALEGAEAQTFINKLPQKLNTYPSTWMEDDDGNKGTELSGGQWQRIAIARNFYRDAAVIILDEPTSAIDALAEARIFKRLFAKTNKKTVVTVSHRLSTVARADNIIVLKDGQIVESGTHSQLVAKKGEYCRIFAEQLEKT